MSNPTSNFGWQMPTATDLVTDLPADFELFGQAVDTDFVDLLGGTTGQVLSKTSATDLDFTWVTANPGDITGVTAGTGITGGGTSGTVTVTNDMATTITAAGDIVVGTGSGTYDNLPIGTTAQILTADTTVSPYKVKWATPASSGSMTLLSTTTLSGTSTVVSSIDQTYEKLYILVTGATNNTANGSFFWRPNNTANLGTYRYPNGDTTVAASFGGDIIFESGALLYQSSSANNAASITIDNYASSTLRKPFSQTSTFVESGGTDAVGSYALGGLKTNTAISSIGFHKAGGGSFTAGTVKIYGVK